VQLLRQYAGGQQLRRRFLRRDDDRVGLREQLFAVLHREQEVEVGAHRPAPERACRHRVEARAAGIHGFPEDPRRDAQIERDHSVEGENGNPMHYGRNVTHDGLPATHRT